MTRAVKTIIILLFLANGYYLFKIFSGDYACGDQKSLIIYSIVVMLILSMQITALVLLIEFIMKNYQKGMSVRFYIKKALPPIVMAIVVLAVLGAWISLELHINPFDGGGIPKWVPLCLALMLLLIAAPGWIGLSLFPKFIPGDSGDLISFYIGQIIAYFLFAHLLNLLIIYFKNRKLIKLKQTPSGNPAPPSS